MDIQNHRFDMTDPFAQVKQRIAQAETLMQQMPPAQRRALVAVMQTPASTLTPCSIDSPVTMASVPVSEWDGGRDVMPRTGTAPLPVIRSRRARVKLPWWWPWFLAAERIDRRLRRWWQKRIQCQPHRRRQGLRRR